MYLNQNGVFLFPTIIWFAFLVWIRIKTFHEKLPSVAEIIDLGCADTTDDGVARTT